MGVQLNKSSDQEIDLVYYFGLLKFSATKFSGWLKNYLRQLWRNAFLFLSIVIVIAAVGYSVRYLIAPAYRTDALFVSHYLPARYYEIMIHDLDQMLNDGNRSVVAQQLRMPTDVAGEIKRFQFEQLRDALIERSDTVLAPFRITLLLSRIDHLEEIQQGILKYLEGQNRIAYTGSPGSNDAMQPQIDILRPFLRINHPNYPNYAKYFIWGLISGVLLAMVLTPTVGKKNAKSQP